MEILESSSGFCMPFEEPNGNVELALGYGNQQHPYSGVDFFHHGLDFKVSKYPLYAVATGVVTGVGTDANHGVYLTTKYGSFDVKYAHLSKITVNYGQAVKAGQLVAVSDDMLHMEVSESGKEINPIDFLQVLFCNMKTIENAANPAEHTHIDFLGDIHTKYDDYREEIEEYLLRFLPAYFQDIHQGHYSPTERTELSLRNLFAFSTIKRYFYESLPSLYNPLGLGMRSTKLVEKAQNLLIGDFLNYLATCHHVDVLNGTSGEKKK